MENNDSKYYTPDISEFHVGFECETNYVLFSKDNQWQPLLLTEQNIALFLDSYIQDASKEEFRVKYLDKEDIEGLGFEVEIVERGEDTEDYPDILYERSSCGAFHEGQEFNIELFNSFFKIKNKAEFKKLAQQLGIHE